MKIGFSGTRQGMTKEQKLSLVPFLRGYSERSLVQFHHGDCIGADAEAHEIVRMGNRLWPNPYTIVGHPPSNRFARAYTNCDVWLPEDAYLKRNKAILTACEIIIATPKEYEPQPRGSGTWMMIRHAAKAEKLITIWPNGQATSNRILPLKEDQL